MSTHPCTGAFCQGCPTCTRCGYRLVAHDGEVDCDTQDRMLAEPVSSDLASTRQKDQP